MNITQESDDLPKKPMTEEEEDALEWEIFKKLGYVKGDPKPMTDKQKKELGLD